MKNELKNQILEFFKEDSKYCPHCDNLRTEVTVKQLPKEAKELKSIMEEGSTLLFCKHCKEYSVTFPIESSF